MYENAVPANAANAAMLVLVHIHITFLYVWHLCGKTRLCMCSQCSSMYTIVHELYNDVHKSTGLFFKSAQEAKDAIPVILINQSRKYNYKPRMALELEDGTIETEPNHPVHISQVPSISVCQPPKWVDLRRMHPEVNILKEDHRQMESIATWKTKHHPPKFDRVTRHMMRAQLLREFPRPEYTSDGYKMIMPN